MISSFHALMKIITLVSDLVKPTSECPSKKKKTVLESRASVENCAKNLFSSPGGKRSFTRHPSLIKLAKSIQEDRRKINSAPSSPVKPVVGERRTCCFQTSQSAVSDMMTHVQSFSSFISGESSNTDFPNKMAQLAAICKIKLDQESV